MRRLFTSNPKVICRPNNSMAEQQPPDVIGRDSRSQRILRRHQPAREIQPVTHSIVFPSTEGWQRRKSGWLNFQIGERIQELAASQHKRLTRILRSLTHDPNGQLRLRRFLFFQFVNLRDQFLQR